MEFKGFEGGKLKYECYATSTHSIDCSQVSCSQTPDVPHSIGLIAWLQDRDAFVTVIDRSLHIYVSTPSRRPRTTQANKTGAR